MENNNAPLHDCTVSEIEEAHCLFFLNPCFQRLAWQRSEGSSAAETDATRMGEDCY